MNGARAKKLKKMVASVMPDLADDFAADRNYQWTTAERRFLERKTFRWWKGLSAQAKANVGPPQLLAHLRDVFAL